MFQRTPLVVFLQRITTQHRLIRGNSYRSQARLRCESAIHELKLENVCVKLAQSTKESWRDHRQQVDTNRTCK